MTEIYLQGYYDVFYKVKDILNDLGLMYGVNIQTDLVNKYSKGTFPDVKGWTVVFVKKEDAVMFKMAFPWSDVCII